MIYHLKLSIFTDEWQLISNFWKVSLSIVNISVLVTVAVESGELCCIGTSVPSLELARVFLLCVQALKIPFVTRELFTGWHEGKDGVWHCRPLIEVTRSLSKHDWISQEICLHETRLVWDCVNKPVCRCSQDKLLASKQQWETQFDLMLGCRGQTVANLASNPLSAREIH